MAEKPPFFGSVSVTPPLTVSQLMSCGRIEVVRCSAPLVVSKSIVSNAPSSVSEPDVVSAESSPTAADVRVRSPLVLSKSRFS